MLVYNYSKDNLVFLTATEGLESPLEPGVTLVPAFATLIPPLTVGENEVSTFSETSNTWINRPSFIGKTAYDKVTKDSIVVTGIGNLPNTFTLLEPTSDADTWDANLNKWQLDLDEFKRLRNNEIDAAAERTRNRYRTSGVSQVGIYLDKSVDAKNYINDGYPADLSNYPYILSESNATGKTPKQSADDIMMKRAEWVTVSAKIEEVRIGSKIAIRAALNNSDIISTYSITMTAFDSI